MPIYTVVVDGNFTDRKEAEAAMSDMEEAIAKNNGELNQAYIEEEDTDD